MKRRNGGIFSPIYRQALVGVGVGGRLAAVASGVVAWEAAACCWGEDRRRVREMPRYDGQDTRARTRLSTMCFPLWQLRDRERRLPLVRKKIRAGGDFVRQAAGANTMGRPTEPGRPVPRARER